MAALPSLSEITDVFVYGGRIPPADFELRAQWIITTQTRDEFIANFSVLGDGLPRPVETELRRLDAQGRIAFAAERRSDRPYAHVRQFLEERGFPPFSPDKLRAFEVIDKQTRGISPRRAMEQALDRIGIQVLDFRMSHGFALPSATAHNSPAASPL